jgi:hypothetical protein
MQNIDDYVIDLLFRKKLFRSKATASPRLKKQNEFVIRDISSVPIYSVHMWTPFMKNSIQRNPCCENSSSCNSSAGDLAGRAESERPVKAIIMGRLPAAGG